MNKTICWWSGGVTSAVACKIAIELFGKKNCRVIFIDTCNEHDDTYRFKDDCQKWYDLDIETISLIGIDYNSIQEVWFKYKSLNVAHGAVCSSELKRRCREKWEKENRDFDHQVFGFEFESKEFNRAKGILLNRPDTKPIFPLLMYGLNKSDCIKLLEAEGVKVPVVYKLGYRNNNCFKTGCVQGGIGYWQKIQKEFPDKFKQMADMEHKLTEIKGKPVTMLKDQSNKSKETGNYQVFLLKNNNYPELKCLADMPLCKVEPLFECNGMCGANDLVRNKTEEELNLE